MTWNSIFNIVNRINVNKQINFLCPENGNCGKSANTTVSYIHFGFENHELNENVQF